VARLYIALVHHPVVNRRGEVVASAVTNLDLHDIARAACTFGAKRFFVTTPLEDQQGFARQIVDHWTVGPGADHIPDRRRAMELVRVMGSLDDAIDAVTVAEARPPRVVATCAREHPQVIGCAALRDQLGGGHPHLLLFGTAWGLAPDVIAAADCVLAPIAGAGGYNHLSVRSAAAIVMDRLLGVQA
jgi:hypothetical protein